MKTPNYLLWTDHRVGFHKMDNIISLTAKNIADALQESERITHDYEHICCVCLFEKNVKTNDYRQIMRSADGSSYHAEGSLVHIERHTRDEIIEWFEFKF